MKNIGAVKTRGVDAAPPPTTDLLFLESCAFIVKCDVECMVFVCVTARWAVHSAHLVTQQPGLKNPTFIIRVCQHQARKVRNAT